MGLFTLERTSLEDLIAYFPYGIPGIAIALCLITVLATSANSESLDAIPSVGPSGPILSYLGAIRFLFDARRMILEGYKKYERGIYKVPNMNRWTVVVSGPKFIEELRRAPDSELSFIHAINETVQLSYTLGAEIRDNPYHTPIVRTQLTRNIGALFPEMRDEIGVAFESLMPMKENEWKKVPALDTVMKVICQTSNRVFVGLPLCRDADYSALSIQFTMDVIQCAIFMNMFPAFLKPFAGKILSKLPRSIKHMERHLGPLVEERERQIKEHGKDWPGKPNDMLAWLMDEAKGEEKSLRDLSIRILTVNFAAIHTSSMTFTHALYHLAAEPWYQDALREEIEGIVAKEGATKAAACKMHKVDSFLRESQRMNSVGSLTMDRRALKPFTFSDGTHIPVGTFMAAAALGAHYDAENYPNPDEFDGFRFAKLREVEGEEVKHQMVTLNPEYIPFGYGRHACPGRFFAANEMKALLIHIVTTYDVKHDKNGARPTNQWFGTNCLPDMKASILFRKRPVVA